MVSDHVIKSCDLMTSHTVVVDFFNRINLIYGTVSDHCTDTTCPIMSGGPKYVTIVMIIILIGYYGYRYEYLWADTNKYKKPTALSAPQYMTILMEWIESIINNENIFVVQTGNVVLLGIN